MVGIVTGVGLGLERSSANVLGANGLLGSPAQGQGGDEVSVNAATGNLIDLRTDQILTGIGLDAAISDAYNSLGNYSPGLGTNDGWLGGYQRSVAGLTGTVNTAGGTITRTAADGSKVVYSYQTSGQFAGQYAANEDAGAYDSLTFNAGANQWTWTDGKSQVKEVYDGANGGRLVTSTDLNGNVVAYHYTGALLTSVTTTDSGGHQDTASLVYNGSNQLTSIQTSYFDLPSGTQKTLTEVYYAYDAQGRLSSVTTDLSPGDNSITDGNTYVTAYAYTSTSSDLIASITQSNGSSVSFTYDGSSRVLTATQTAASGVTRTTSFSYGAGVTTVTDPTGIVTQLYFDGSGELTKTVVDPTGLNLVTQFTYDAMGDVTTATAPDGATETYTYDASGNRLSQVDAAGDTTTFTYGSMNQVLSVTRYVNPQQGTTGASGPQTTYYVYDAHDNLNYTVSSLGDVTQYQYNSSGQQISFIQYTNDLYNGQAAPPPPVVGSSSQTVAAGSASDPIALSLSGGAAAGVTITSGPAHGSLSISGPLVTYTPTAGYTGADSFTYTANNAGGTSSVATVSLTVATASSGAPPTPVAGASSQTVAAGSSIDPIALNLSGGAASGVTITAGPAHGSVSVSGASVTYTPTAGYTGADSFTYTASNAGGTSSAATVALTVAVASSGAPPAPVSAASTQTVAAGSSNDPISLKLSGGAASSITVTANPAHGTVSVSGAGVTYTPTAGYTGADSFTYTAANAGGASGAATVSLTVAAAPAVVALTPTSFSASSNDGGGYSGLTASGMSDGVFNTAASAWVTGADATAYIEADLGSKASIDHVLLADVPTASCLPGAGATSTNGAYIQYSTDNVTWTNAVQVSGVTDGAYSSFSLGGATARYVRLVLSSASVGVGDFIIYGSTLPAPVANAVSTAVAYGSSSDAVVLNITGAATSVAVTSGPAHGSVSVSGTTITYTPTAGYVGADSFSYTATGAGGTSAAAAASITVNGPVAAPVANAVSAAVAYNSSNDPVVLNITGAPTSVAIGSGPAHGSVSVSGTTITYTPTAGYVGADSFTYAATNAAGASAAATASITVNSPVVAPVANAVSTAVAYGSTNDPVVLNITGQVTSVSIGTAPLHGSVTVSGTTITYTPTAGYSGSDSFTYKATNAAGTSAVATATITVNANLSSGPSLTQMNAWVAGLSDLANTKRTDIAYDFRGNVASVTSYGSDTSTGAGNTAATTEITKTNYVYDSAGRLLQKLPGAAQTAYVYGGTQRLPTNAAGQTFIYDGLGRLLATTDLTGATTTMVYNTSATTTTVTLANGTTETSVYDKAGELLSYSVAGAGMTTATTTYKYDADGRLMTVTDPTGLNTYYLYDNAGRKTAEIAADGAITEYRYNAASEVNETIQYATRLTPAQLSALAAPNLDAHGNPIPTAIATVRPAANAADRYSWAVYDAAHRLVETIDGTGAVTVLAYDGESNVTSSTQYFNLLAGATLSALQSSPPTGLILPTASPGADQVTRTFYDADGREVGSLNGDGYLTEILYDDAGQKTQTIAFATQASSALWAGGSFGQLLASVGTSAADDHTWYVYDARGLLRGVVDGDGDVTQYHYTPLSQVDQTITGQQLSVATLLTTPPTLATLTGLSTAGSAIDVTNYTFNLNGQVLTKVETVGGGANLTTTETYDIMGRLVAITDADGHVSRFVYDAAGRQIYTVDGLGDVVQTTYDTAGRAVTVHAFAGQVASGTLAGWALQVTAAQVSAAVSASSSDETTNYVYDTDGRLAYSLDANLRLTEYDYDAGNNLIQKIEYAGSVTAASSYSVAYVQSQITSQGLTSLAGNRTTRYVYDADGREAYCIDAAGDVTAYAYDGQGDRIKTDRYATAYAASGVPTLSAMQSWAAGNSTATDRITRTIYDAAGRIVYEVNGAGYVTGYSYNAMGEVAAQTRYALSYSVSDGVTASSLAALIGSPTGSQVTTFAYDSAGRLIQSTDPLGIVTRLTLDTVGRVTDSVLAYGTGDAADTHFTYDAAGRLTAATLAYGQAEATTTSYTYDGLGRVLSVSDGRGNVTHHTYDALGHVLTTTDPLGAVTTNKYNAFGNLTETVDPRGNAGFFYYDLLNRLVLQVDPDGYATATSYTIGDQTASVTRYHLVTTGTPTTTTPPTVNTSGADETTTFTRDKDDRLTGEADAAGATQSFGLDAFGDRLSATNQLGGTTHYAYDARGLMTSQVLPITSVTASGSTEATSVTTTYAYDGFGNRVTMVEASGLTEQRTTSYVYDADNRLTKAIVDPGSGHLNLTTTTTYDNRGNAIETVDPNGNKTFLYYDHANRKIAQVNALGALTQWTYDGNGNALTQTVYGDFLASLPSSPGGTPPSPVNPSNYRQTTYAYDKDNRLTTSTVAGILTGAYNGTAYQTSTVSLTTTRVYDANGDVIQTIDANGASTYFYYDQLGRKIGQVDPSRNLTTYALDQDGNVTSETQYATALAAGFSTTTLPTQTSNGSDRTTTFTYDKDGRRLTESRQNVAYASISNTGAMTPGSAAATITYTYNGLGEVTSQTQATGDAITYVYDSEGRQSSATGGSYTDASGATDTPQTVYSYDGLGDLTRAAVGNAGSPSRVTTYTYGAAGRLAATTDPTGFTQSYAYDADGNVTTVSYGRVTSSNTAISEEVISQYDGLNRQVYQATADWNGSAWVAGDAASTRYDSYGEVTGKGVNGLYQQTFAYDGAGRQIESTGGNGSATFYLYDADGNQTLQLASSGTSLAGDTLSQALAADTSGGVIASAYVAGVDPTITQYDARGEATATIQPFQQLSAATTTTLTATRAYDAFGDVTSQTDNVGATTNFTYNALGHLTSVQGATISYTDQTGVAHNATPTGYQYYDLGGRLVASQDANGNLTTNLLLAGSGYNGAQAQTVEQFQPDNGQMIFGYDVFGDQTKVTDQLGRVTTRTFDGAGRLLTQTTPVVGSVALTQFYAYDGLGQRLAQTNSLLASSLSVSGYASATLLGAAVAKASTGYDTSGRIIKTVDYLGFTATNVYVWSSALATTGLGTFGGWTETSVNTSGLTQTNQTDVFGHTIGKTEFGGHVYTYTYNAAGELVGQTNNAGQNVAISYFNTGQLATLTSTTATGAYDQTVYGYDGNGRKTLESNGYYYPAGLCGPAGSISYENETATYNAMGWLTSISDSGNTAAHPMSITYAYDQNGNVVNLVSNYNTLGGNNTGTAAAASENYWYKYDSMNREVLSEGQLISGAITRGYQGTDIVYDAAGERVSASTSSFAFTSGNLSYDNVHTEWYAYTADGYLSQVKIADNQVATGSEGDGTANPTTAYVAVAYTNDAMGRLTQETQYNSAGTATYVRSGITYDADSLMTGDSTSQLQSSGAIEYLSNSYYYEGATSTGGYIPTSGTLGPTSGGVFLGGQLVAELTTAYSMNGSTRTNQPTYYYSYSYAWSNQAQESQIAWDPNTGGSTIYYTTLSYDINGYLTGATISDGAPHTVTYVNNFQGQILDRTDSAGPVNEYYYLNGHTIGALNNTGADQTDYAQQITNQINGQPAATAGANFDQNYAELGSNAPAATGQTYQVQAGDTLQSIAQTLWGDANLWYLLADANGLSGGSVLSLGENLNVPNDVINVGHTSATYKPYSAATATGFILPNHLPPPPPPHHSGGCGGIAAILIAIVAIVVIAVLQPELLAPFAQAFGPEGLGLSATVAPGASAAAAATIGTTGIAAGSAAGIAGAVAAGAVAGAVGSIVSQGVALALGLQSKFSWSGVALGFIGGAVGAGLPNITGGINASLFGSNASVLAGVQAAEDSALTQGIGVATGLQKSFNWTAVATAGIEAGVETAVAPTIEAAVGAKLTPQGLLPENTQGFAAAALIGAAGAIAGGAARSVITGEDFGQSVIDELPNTVGTTIGEWVAGDIEIEQEKAKAVSLLQKEVPSLPTDRAYAIADALVEDPSKLLDALGLRQVSTNDASDGGNTVGDGDAQLIPAKYGTKYDPSKQGWHDYTVTDVVIPASLHYNLSEALDAFDHYGVPGNPGMAVQDGQKYMVYDPLTGIPAGYVISTVSNGGFTITNTTTLLHVLYDGEIVRNLFENPDGSWSVTTHGFGNNVVPGAGTANQYYGPVVFQTLDLQMYLGTVANSIFSSHPAPRPGFGGGGATGSW